MNHQDIVERERAHDFDASSAESILACLVRVVKALPPEEHGGLLRKDAGENILFYPPANCNVSISRVCYPDGQLYKIFTDAGPNGANGPAWNDDGTVETNRYIAVPSSSPAPDPMPIPAPPPPPVPAPVDLTPLLSKLDQLHADNVALGQEVDGLQTQIQELAAKPDPVVKVTWPAYIGSIFGVRVKLVPEVK